jgi:hypothetical protein
MSARLWLRSLRDLPAGFPASSEYLDNNDIARELTIRMA